MENPQEFVHRIQEDTRQYLNDLLAQAQRLTAIIGELDGERSRLSSEVVSLRLALASRDKERLELSAQVRSVQDENSRLALQYGHVEQQNSTLASLYVATHRLHGTLDRNDVLEGIKEIVINLIGCEELAVYEVDEREELSAVAHFGDIPTILARLRPSEGLLGKVAATKAPFVRSGGAASPGDGDASPRPEETHLTAAIPLVVGDRLVGLIAIFRLLGHKPSLLPADFELLELLGSHAATALHVTSGSYRTPAPGR